MRVDGDLPADSGNLVYAKQGAEGSIWMAIMEKAWAVFRTGIADYDDIAGGPTSEVAEALNLDYDYTSKSSYNILHGSNGLFDKIADELAAGNAFTLSSSDDGGAVLAGNHLYAVQDVYWEGGVRKILLYNPWGQSEEYTMDDVWDSIDGFTVVEM